MAVGIGLLLVWGGGLASVRAEEFSSGSGYLREASQYYYSGQYFRAARYAFAASENVSSLKADAYAWITMSLMHAGLPNTASYFFIRTLQSGQRTAIKSVLTQTQDLLLEVGADILRKYLIRHTRYEDYNSENLSAYLYALGKDAILAEEFKRALGYLDAIQVESPLWAYAQHLKGTAKALLDRADEAIEDFKACRKAASRSRTYLGHDPQRIRQADREAEDLEARCWAGQARTLYQEERFVEAERVYDKIPKRSYVWTDILFEQAWNAFAKQEWNRSLGKLVSYKSPALSFVFNPEIEVLQAQSYLALCLYADVDEVVKSFHSRYTPAGIEIKNFVESHAHQLPDFYALGKTVLSSSLYSKQELNRLTNRFVRGPYFQNLVATESRIRQETEAIRSFDSTQSGVSHNLGNGFPGFLRQVLSWRTKTLQLLGGAYVKNSLLDYHEVLLSDYDKMSFIKLDLIKKNKDKLIYKSPELTERSRGAVEPTRQDDQYYWSFNGEFWSDELGDYVFGLESACQG